MSFRKQPQVTDNAPSWNIDEPLARQKLKDFEREIGERSFTQYCYDMGYVLDGSGFWPKGTVARAKVGEYEQTKAKYAALERLQERRYYAQKEAHKALIAPEIVCGNKDENRCTLCYPYSIREHLVRSGNENLVKTYDSLVIHSTR